MTEKQLPNFSYISESYYYDKVDFKNFVGLARVQGYKQLVLNEEDTVIYLQFDSNDIDLINECIKQIVDTSYLYWKSYSKEIRTCNNIEN